mgnify:CR=1 FL=1
MKHKKKYKSLNAVKPIQFQTDLSLMEKVVPILVASLLGTALGTGIFCDEIKDKKEKTPEPVTPQIQKITDPQKTPVQNTSRGARTE